MKEEKTSWMVGRETAHCYIDPDKADMGLRRGSESGGGEKESWQQIASGGVEGPRKARRRYRLVLVCMRRYFGHPLATCAVDSPKRRDKVQ